jgi:hypothetical protein
MARKDIRHSFPNIIYPSSTQIVCISCIPTGDHHSTQYRIRSDRSHDVGKSGLKLGRATPDFWKPLDLLWWLDILRCMGHSPVVEGMN